MGYVYEVVCKGVHRLQPIANVFHVWDGAETVDQEDIADVFELNYLTDLITVQSDESHWSEITVKALDVGNPVNPISRTVSKTGALDTDDEPPGIHMWVKLISDDAGFKSGGKLISGLVESQIDGGNFQSTVLDAFQDIFEDLLIDLAAAALAGAILRPVLSTPGFPSISQWSSVLVRGLGTNNRRQKDYQR
jgi:hypothetical protein